MYQEFIDYCQCANNTGGENIAYCTPYGNKDWGTLWSLYGTKIQPFLQGCHQGDRLNPIAWLDCGEAVYEIDVTRWVTLYSKLSFSHYSQEFMSS